MKRDYKILDNKKINERKRKNQKEFNYINNYDKIQELEFDDIKNIYSNRIDELKNSKLLYNKENELYLLKFDNIQILIRDDIEKRFFFNSFINEYLDYKSNLEKEEKEKMNFKKFIIDISNFLIFKDKNIIILDIEKDYK